MRREGTGRSDGPRPPAQWQLWNALIVGIVIGAIGATLVTSLTSRTRRVQPAASSGTVPVPAPAAPAGPYYVVVEKHYLDLGTGDDTVNWFYGTVRNDGTARGTCDILAYFFNEDDRSIETGLVRIKPLDPGQLTTFHIHPTVQNAESAGVKFTGNCGHGKMWHYQP